MTLELVEYRDKQGRAWRRGLPDGTPASQAAHGVPLGPPSLKALELPEKVEVRLHNELYNRGIFTLQDAQQNVDQIRSALKAALSTDVVRIIGIYQGSGAVNAEDQ